MNSAANQLHRPFRLFMAMVLLLLLPFIGITPRAAAMDAHAVHAEQHMPVDLDCAAACARTAHAPSPQAIFSENETRVPDPEPREIVPYHIQFQAMPAPRKLRPAAMYGSMPSRPPDIVKLSGHFLF